jgi:NTP pyrophosphatase (non-canonical NTP hydrolase)
MDLNDYQRFAAETAIYPGRLSTTGLLYTALGLGEAGEIQGKVKKVLRDANGTLSDEARKAIAAEVGDLLWYVSQIADELGVKLNDIAIDNLAKLNSRRERGVLQGSGDNR